MGRNHLGNAPSNEGKEDDENDPKDDLSRAEIGLHFQKLSGGEIYGRSLLNSCPAPLQPRTPDPSRSNLIDLFCDVG